jgi:hypothetical protein
MNGTALQALPIQYLTEEQHAARMARAIYGASNKRVTLVRGWDSLNVPMQAVFLELGRRVVEQVDAVKRQQNR